MCPARVRLDVRRRFFSIRVISVWNSLSPDTVEAVRPVFVQHVFVQYISSNPIRLGLDENRFHENRLDPNELDEK